MPDMAQPLMLAVPHSTISSDPLTVVRQLTASGEWMFEFKYDGVRALVSIRNGVINITNRNGRDITYRYPDVVAGLARLTHDTTEQSDGSVQCACGAVSQRFGTRARSREWSVDHRRTRSLNVVLDGEIICPDENGRPDFHRVHRRDAQGNPFAAKQLATTLPAQFVVFDVLELKGTDLRGLTYFDRRSRLLDLAEDLAGCGVVGPPVSPDGAMMWAVVQDMGLEGLVAKRTDSKYTGKRGPAWVKIKATRQLSALVCGFDDGTGHRAATFGALRLALLDAGGQLVEVGSVGSGFTDADLRTIRGRLDRGDHPIIVEVAYLEMSPTGQLRQPVFKGLRSDVDAAACTLSQQEDQ